MLSVLAFFSILKMAAKCAFSSSFQQIHSVLVIFEYFLAGNGWNTNNYCESGDSLLKSKAEAASISSLQESLEKKKNEPVG